MSRVKRVASRRVLNSHAEFVNEFILELTDGSVGLGSPPKGETTSIYEAPFSGRIPESVVTSLREAGMFERVVDQQSLDSLLEERLTAIGRENCYAISLAYFEAEKHSRRAKATHVMPRTPRKFPYLCLNILNGGNHAYTNPVMSDFTEYLIVSKTDDLEEVIIDHSRIQAEVRSHLLTKPTTSVGGNSVHRLGPGGNRDCIEFLLNILEHLRLGQKYDPMIDASAGDLCFDQGYRLSVTDGSLMTPDEFCEYWLDLLRQYPISFLEDPFQEKDYSRWKRLKASQTRCLLLGDNLYCSQPSKISDGATQGFTDGVVVKPDQAGTVSAAIAAVKTAQRLGQIVVASHRSVSTESVFLSDLTHLSEIRYAKIGPLLTDYSSIVRLNELVRLGEASD